MRSALAIGVAIAICCGGARAGADEPPAIKAVVDGRFPVAGAAGGGLLPIALSQDWSRPLPGISRAVVIVHGYSRNADDYFKSIAALAPDEHTLVVAPQFLASEDAAAHSLPDSVLRWKREAWSGGGDAEGASPVSSFEAIDGLLLALADHVRLPDLQTIVLAGFSAGGQLVQRYTAVGQAADKIEARGIPLHYVVGSPSSYLYFSDERPLPEGGFGPFARASACPNYDGWKYGLAGVLPRYVEPALKDGAVALERRYAGLDVVYLLGGADNDPNHPQLDKSCAAEAQGPSRLDRGLAYFAYLREHNGTALRQRLWQIPGVAHQHARVFASLCGRAALFGVPGCPDS
ncbi:MAG TPA: hypothetical protein VF007_10605 [Stellaceae bacterium]